MIFNILNEKDFKKLNGRFKELPLEIPDIQLKLTGCFRVIPGRTIRFTRVPNSYPSGLIQCLLSCD